MSEVGVEDLDTLHAIDVASPPSRRQRQTPKGLRSVPAFTMSAMTTPEGSPPGTPSLQETAAGLRKTLSFKTLSELRLNELRLQDVKRHVWRDESEGEDTAPRKPSPRDLDQLVGHAVRGGVRAFLLGFGARGGLALVLVLFSAIRKGLISFCSDISLERLIQRDGIQNCQDGATSYGSLWKPNDTLCIDAGIFQSVV